MLYYIILYEVVIYSIIYYIALNKGIEYASHVSQVNVCLTEGFLFVGIIL